MSMQKWQRSSRLYPLPDVVDTLERICTKILLPDDPTHISNFIGALYTLTLWSNYIPDPTGIRLNKPVADVWRDIWSSIEFLSADECGGSTDSVILDCCECEDDMQFRFDDCKLEGSCDGVHWTLIADITSCVTDLIRKNVGKPGPGNDPAPGTCKTYSVVLQGSDLWQIPANLPAGSTIQVTNVDGAWSDSYGISKWFCPDGTPFLMGACAGTRTHVGGDLSSVLWHGQLIAVLNDTSPIYFDPTTLYTIPAGKGSKAIWFQQNDQVLADNQGTITFDLEICVPAETTPIFNPAVYDWVKEWDFAAAQGEWYAGSIAGTPPNGYIAGKGWSSGTAAGAINAQVYATGTATTYVRYIYVEYTVVNTPCGNNIAVTLANVPIISSSQNTTLYNKPQGGSGFVELLLTSANQISYNGKKTNNVGMNSFSNQPGWSSAQELVIKKVRLAGYGTTPTWSNV